MPSFNHQFLIYLFTQCAELAPELLRICTGIAFEHAEATIGTIDLSQVVPTEFRADLVVYLHDTKHRIIKGIIIEVQRGIDSNKLLSWPAYVANLRSDKKCDALLIVIATNARVAAWARRAIPLGHPGFELTPIVLSLDDIPRIHAAEKASNMPELPMLSLIAHREIALADIALRAIEHVTDARHKVYSGVIEKTVNDIGEAHEQ